VRVGKYPRIWYSEFQKLFKKPFSHWALPADTMPSDGDVRRQ
jgi:hypothetical protein